jgi:Transposase DDE domain
MENQLIQIYLFVCRIYDSCSATCFQRLSNNHEPKFTDQELLTIWIFAHLNEKFQKKQMQEFIKNYWSSWFPLLPAYQTFVLRLNQLEPSFQTIGSCLFALLENKTAAENDQLIDSFPVMLAAQGHSYDARVGREIANAGYCAAKKARFHGVRLHLTAQRRTGRLPVPTQVWLTEASLHDSKAVKEQAPSVSSATAFADLAYLDKQIKDYFKQQQAKLITPYKKAKGTDLTDEQKYYNRLVSRFRQPVESLFN